MLDIVALIYEDHDWFRRHFFYLDHAHHETELRAIWEPLAARLDVHAEAEETIFYPALLRAAGDPEAETEDAIGDHKQDPGRGRRGTPPHDRLEGVVGGGRQGAQRERQSGLDEEEREGLARTSSRARRPEQRHELAMDWLRFYYRHYPGRTPSKSPRIEPRDKDPQEYIARIESGSRRSGPRGEVSPTRAQRRRRTARFANPGIAVAVPHGHR